MESQPNILRHANTMPPQGLAHQRSVARKPVGRPVVSTPIAQTTLVHRPAPQQQQQLNNIVLNLIILDNILSRNNHNQLSILHNSNKLKVNTYNILNPKLFSINKPITHLSSSIINSLKSSNSNSRHCRNIWPKPSILNSSRFSNSLRYHNSRLRHNINIPKTTNHRSAPNITSQTPQPTLANTHQTPPPPQPQPQPQATPASPAPQAHHNDPGYNNIANSFVTEHGRPASISSSPSIATPATTISSIATPSVIGTPTWKPTAIPPPIQQTPAVDIRRTSTGQPSLCNHCRKAIPLNVSVYTCLICSTAHIATNFCVWCFTSNAVNTSHSHDKSYYATESDPRVQPLVQDATTHMWTIRKNVSGRLWYTHNATGLKTHLKPTAAALSGFSGLPPGWDERRTPDGRTFYFNKRMGTSAWTKPANSLPEGWKELRTPDAVPFYVNEQLGLSTWDRPGQQPKQQTKNKVVVRRARPVPGQPNTPQNVGDNLLSATINAARLTGQGVESASRQVGKLGKRKNWRKLGRMLNQVNGLTGDNSGSDCEYNDYNDDGGFGFGDDQQQGQFQQSFDYQQSFGDQSQQSFDLGDNQQQSMFQQPAYEQQTTFEYSIQTGQPEFDPSAFQQQPEQFSITTEVSYSTTEPQPMLEQQPYEPQQDQYVQQTYEQQSSVEIQQQTTYESIPAQDPIPTDASQQVESFEPVPPQQVECQPPPVSQESYVQPMQQTYSTQQYTYDSTQGPQMIQQEVTVSYQVPTYEPALTFVPQAQPQQPVYPVYVPNNQPEIITSDDHLVEVPGTPDTTTLNLNSGYGGNDILAGTSLAAEQNPVVTQAPQDDVVVKVTIEQSQSPALGTTCGPEPVVVQEYTTAGKTETVVSVDAVVAENNFDVSERCLALI
ncbi:tpa inducible [Fusarium longipes]|uniref:Tpa inducible n=1 Tax=Fusarium longipes TaxID=694270 RepID=A0A395RLQ9_9HYPO|nr:tpa inducible [Fusarium longipes]